jgi:ribosomal-protein-alanine N-acetyltransferase
MWSRESLSDAASSGAAWTAEVEGLVAGILIGRAAADEFEILNLAVAKAHRRQGVATRLVAAALESARKAGAAKTYLEVRASNEGGIALYSKLGFRISGRRAKYYRDPEEDAVLLVLDTDGTAT